jgi:hypothetical protein
MVSIANNYAGHARRFGVVFFCFSWISVVWTYSSTSPIFPSPRRQSSDAFRGSSPHHAENFSDTSLSFLRPSVNCNVDQMSATDLAYIGDVVFELYIRSRTVWPPKRTADVQLQAVALVRGRNAFRA